jgi:hypothetical protein
MVGPTRGVGATRKYVRSRTLGSLVLIEVVSPVKASTTISAHDVLLGASDAFRAIPLLAALKADGDRLIAVGQTRVVTRRNALPRVTVVVRRLWQASVQESVYGDPLAVAHAVGHWRVIPHHDQLDRLLTAWVKSAIGSPSGDADGAATSVAKDLAERSRDTVAVLRSFRYGLEEMLARTLRGGSTNNLELVLADIIELSTVCNRAGDEAREAVREGMWTWRTDPAAYHAHRRMLDGSLPALRGDHRGRRRPWFATLDAGVRQCEGMARLIGEETPLLHSLLNAASTIAVTRDARAQETFNFVATVGGVLFGMPALILALYSATSVLPLTKANVIVFAPLAAAGMLASALAAFLPGSKGRGRARRFAAAGAAMLIILLLLIVAGTLVHPDG